MSFQLFAQSETVLMGGVDVGNGGRIVAGLNEGFFKTEDELVFHIKDTVQQIHANQHPRVRRWIEQGQCEFKMDFASTDVIDSYRSVKGTWTKGVVGYSRVLLEKCKKPFAIDADEHPANGSIGGDEDWFFPDMEDGF